MSIEGETTETTPGIGWTELEKMLIEGETTELSFEETENVDKER
jgi:hypothetical protein